MKSIQIVAAIALSASFIVGCGQSNSKKITKAKRGKPVTEAAQKAQELDQKSQLVEFTVETNQNIRALIESKSAVTEAEPLPEGKFVLSEVFAATDVQRDLLDEQALENSLDASKEEETEVDTKETEVVETKDGKEEVTTEETETITQTTVVEDTGLITFSRTVNSNNLNEFGITHKFYSKMTNDGFSLDETLKILKELNISKDGTITVDKDTKSLDVNLVLTKMIKTQDGDLIPIESEKAEALMKNDSNSKVTYNANITLKNVAFEGEDNMLKTPLGLTLQDSNKVNDNFFFRSEDENTMRVYIKNINKREIKFEIIYSNIDNPYEQHIILKYVPEAQMTAASVKSTPKPEVAKDPKAKSRNKRTSVRNKRK